MTNKGLVPNEFRTFFKPHTLQSLVPIVFVNEDKVWRLGQPNGRSMRCRS